MAQWFKLQPMTLASHIRTLLLVQAAPLPLQLPSNKPRKVADDGPNVA